MKKTSRGYAITINHYTDEHLDVLRDLERTKYILAVEEHGDEEHKTTHIQGLIIWNSAKPWKRAKQLLPEGTHLENLRSSPKANEIYCKKGVESGRSRILLELGTPPSGQGSRSDIHDLHKEVKECKSLDEVLLRNPTSIKYHRGMGAVYDARLRTEASEVKFKVPEVYVLWGEAGSGKSRWCYKNYPDLYTVPM